MKTLYLQKRPLFRNEEKQPTFQIDVHVFLLFMCPCIFIHFVFG